MPFVALSGESFFRLHGLGFCTGLYTEVMELGSMRNQKE